MIVLDKINKTFRRAKRNAGFGEALKALFSREYEVVHALEDLSFKIEDGEMVGYIGPNGAGKSTTIKILCGVLNPDSGSCVVDGRIPWKDRLRHVRDIGVVFGQRSQLWWDVPVIDSFELIRDIYKVDAAAYNRNLEELTALLDLSELVRTPARSLSLGQRMRCELAASLLHNPRILFLDEPTIGLDAVSKIAVRSFIKKLNSERGTTVILTTHDMQDIEALTERILLIGRGRILLDGTLRELKRRFSDRKILVVEYNGAAPVLCEGMKLAGDKTAGSEEGRMVQGRMVISIDPADLPVSAAIAHIASQTDILDISVSGISTEEMAAALYREYNI